MRKYIYFSIESYVRKSGCEGDVVTSFKFSYEVCCQLNYSVLIEIKWESIEMIDLVDNMLMVMGINA